MNKLIKFLGLEDYFYFVCRYNEYNTTGKLELHSLNSDSYNAVGILNSAKCILKYKIGW